MYDIIEKPVDFRYLKELPDSLKWEYFEPFFKDLESRDINDKESLVQFIKDWNEISVYLGEEVRWVYVQMSQDTENKDVREKFSDYLTNIEPKLREISFELEKKLLLSPAIKELDNGKYGIFIRNVKNQVELYRKENLELQKDLKLLEKEYGVISGKMTIELDGKEVPLSAAQNKLKDPDRSIRKEVFEKVQGRRYQDKEELNSLFNKLLNLRAEIAKNAGFDNFRDYKFKSMNRFDYSAKDCFEFHDSIEALIVPLLKKNYEEKKAALKLDVFKPYDLDVNPDGSAPSVPFKSQDELVQKTVKCMSKVNPFFGKCLQKMSDRGHLDLEGRKGKAPGGFNMSLPKTGGAFIFMNASGSERDVRTMLHEAGHAVHSFLMDNQQYDFQKSIPSEVAELASMSMELFTFDYWDIFYNDEKSLKKAKKNQLESILQILPWVATIDSFQHWIYTNPGHTDEERSEYWLKCFNRFSPDIVDWTGYENYKEVNWQKQLHLYQVPFYYIEYAMAQLGAVAMWKQYKTNPEEAINNYMNALSLGNSRSIPELYETAGIKFDFSKKYLEELKDFLLDEISKLK
ncbi:MAG: M3 family oligoendopeptidase [Chitinophagaceae bacterium]|nr:MAG: M3 family oligoendopeptidase [Chitinophagaceae bacterium]